MASPQCWPHQGPLSEHASSQVRWCEPTGRRRDQSRGGGEAPIIYSTEENNADAAPQAGVWTTCSSLGGTAVQT